MGLAEGIWKAVLLKAFSEMWTVILLSRKQLFTVILKFTCKIIFAMLFSVKMAPPSSSSSGVFTQNILPL